MLLTLPIENKTSNIEDMQTGFIQIPVIIAILIGVSVLGGAGYVAYKASNPPQDTQKQGGATLNTETDTLNANTSSLKDRSEENEEIERLKQEVQDLKKQAGTKKPETTGRAATVQVEAPVNLPLTLDSLRPTQGVTSEQIERLRWYCTLGEGKNACSKEGFLEAYYAHADLRTTIDNLTEYQKKSLAAQEVFIRPDGAPSLEQLRRLMWMCGYTEDLAKFCDTDGYLKDYFTSIPFRTLIDELIIRAQQELEEQQAQNELARQRYLQYLQYTSYVPPSIPPRIETYSLPAGGLEIDTPQFQINRRWEVQWTGGGRGFVTDTSGETTYFQCLADKCFSL
jgi:hypothetical protein